jgi:xanthine dehydrogenase molybdenum-binding subunit
VLVDGKAIVSCQQSLEKVANTNITTLEGVSQVERDAFANAFAACGGLQCGFCIPGIVVRAKAQIDKKGAGLKREDMARHLGAHLCRCTGYVKILDAIDSVAKQLSPEIVSTGGLGVRVAKHEAKELALGDRGYIDDMRLPGLMHASLVFTKHARAEILSINTSKAMSRPGVRAVFTAADIPGELMMGIIYKDWPVMIPVGGFTSYAGEVLAIIFADSRLNARNAIDDVVVEYKPLTPITDARNAIASNDIAVWKTDSNILSKSTYKRGDAELAIASSTHVVR